MKVYPKQKQLQQMPCREREGEGGREGGREREGVREGEGEGGSERGRE